MRLWNSEVFCVVPQFGASASASVKVEPFTGWIELAIGLCQFIFSGWKIPRAGESPKELNSGRRVVADVNGWVVIGLFALMLDADRMDRQSHFKLNGSVIYL